MKFMLMMSAPRGTGDWAVMKWNPEALKAHIGHMKDLNVKLRDAGELVAAEGLAPPAAAKQVKAKPGGGFETDGPFAEAKEFLAGWWIVDVESEKRAYEIAAEASLAPGTDGKPMYLAIEVRQVMQAPV